MENFVYSVETKKTFEEAVISVLKSVDQKSWALFQIYDLKERLSAKGFNLTNLKIIEICSAKYANKLLSKNKFVSMCMPCKINVIEDNNKVYIAGMRPTIMPDIFQGITKEEAQEVEDEIISIINNAK